jgi:hypothetical protein
LKSSEPVLFLTPCRLGVFVCQAERAELAELLASAEQDVLRVPGPLRAALPRRTSKQACCTPAAIFSAWGGERVVMRLVWR